MWGALNSFRSSADWLSYTTLAFDWFMVACRSKVAVEKACYGHVTEALAVVTSQRGSRKLGRDLSLLTQRWWMVQWSFACFPVHFFCANWLQQLSGKLSEKSDPLFQSFFQKKQTKQQQQKTIDLSFRMVNFLCLSSRNSPDIGQNWLLWGDVIIEMSGSFHIWAKIGKKRKCRQQQQQQEQEKRKRLCYSSQNLSIDETRFHADVAGKSHEYRWKRW